MNYQPIIQKTRAYLCLDCGKCTGSCPLARVDPDFSPRRIVERVIFGDAEEVLTDPHLWACMTCGLCSARCPSDVDFDRFIIEMRAAAFQAGERGTYAHNGVLQEIMRVQTKSGRMNRTGWITGEMQTSEGAIKDPADAGSASAAMDGEYFYFTGCLPFFDVIFGDLGVNALEIARGAVRLMNRAGIRPIVSSNERCCGVDLLLAGDVTSFRNLAELNMETIRASGASKVVFTCAECYHAFRSEYPAHVGQLPFETMHLTELLAQKIKDGELELEPRAGRVTYHDPCRMGRQLKVHSPPRAVLNSVPDLELVEMEDNRERSMCCGSTAWVNCGGCAKQIQQEKLRQARETGAGVMLTTCPKCQIHLACALRDLDKDETIVVDDVISWIG